MGAAQSRSGSRTRARRRHRDEHGQPGCRRRGDGRWRNEPGGAGRRASRRLAGPDGRWRGRAGRGGLPGPGQRRVRRSVLIGRPGAAAAAASKSGRTNELGSWWHVGFHIVGSAAVAIPAVYGVVRTALARRIGHGPGRNRWRGRETSRRSAGRDRSAAGASSAKDGFAAGSGAAANGGSVAERGTPSFRTGPVGTAAGLAIKLKVRLWRAVPFARLAAAAAVSVAAARVRASVVIGPLGVIGAPVVIGPPGIIGAPVVGAAVVGVRTSVVVRAAVVALPGRVGFHAGRAAASIRPAA